MPYRLEDCVAKNETGKALLVDIPDLDEKKWVSHDEIHETSEVNSKGDEGDLVISDRLARKWSLV